MPPVRWPRRCANLLRGPASSGSAPTTATCRSAWMAAIPSPTSIGNITGRAQAATCRFRASSLRTSTRALPTWRSTPSQRRLEAVSVQDHRLRQDLDQRHRRPPGKGQHQRLARGSTTIPNLLFVGTEFGLYVTLDGWQELEEVHDRSSQRSRGRYPDPSARPRSDRRHPRPLHLDLRTISLRSNR